MVERKKVAFISRTPPSERLSRHYELATKVLGNLKSELCKSGISYMVDTKHPYNTLVLILTETRLQMYSCYCSGFNKYIDIQKLTPKGKPDRRTQERRFASSKAVVNFLVKKNKADPHILKSLGGTTNP